MGRRGSEQRNEEAKVERDPQRRKRKREQFGPWKEDRKPEKVMAHGRGYMHSPAKAFTETENVCSARAPRGPINTANSNQFPSHLSTYPVVGQGRGGAQLFSPKGLGKKPWSQRV